MLRRRISEHVKTQNWVAVCLDFLIVVIGVFIGLQVSNWNDARQEREKERGYLINLYQDFSQSSQTMNRVIGYLEEQLGDHKLILKSLEQCAIEDQDAYAFQRGIQSLAFIDRTRLFRRTFDELSASGNMDVIQNAELRLALSNTIAQAERRENLHESTLRMVERGHDIVMAYVLADMSTPLNGHKYFVELRVDINEMCSDPHVAHAVSDVSLHTKERYIGLQGVAEQYEALLPGIADELDARWGYSLPNEIGEE